MDFDFIKKNALVIFLFFSFLILGILISTNYFSSKNLETDVLNQYFESRDLLLEKTSINIENDIENKKAELNLIEKKISLNEIILNSCSQDLFKKTPNKLNYLENYFIVNKKGKIIACSDEKFKDYLNLNIGSTNYFKEFLDSKKSIAKIIKTTNPPQIFILTPIKNNKNLISTLSIVDFSNIYSRYIHELIGNNNLNYFYIIDLKSKEVIMKNEHFKNSKISELVNKNSKFEILNFNSNDFIFNKKQFKIGNNIIEIGILSNTNSINNLFKKLNNKHLTSIIFISAILIFIFLLLTNLNLSKIKAEKKLRTANLILEKYNINYEFETQKILSLTENDLGSGNIFFIRDDKIQAFEIFVKEISKKKIGLCFLKDNINNFKKKYNLEKTSFISLSDDDSINNKYKNETKIIPIYTLISKFLNENKNLEKIIFIDSIDYLILKNNFKEVFKVLYDLKDKIKNSKNILLFSINQNIISQRELLAFENEFVDIETEEKKSLNNLSQIKIDILIYINSLNNNKINVRYKDISNKFNITKPTTSKKIKELENEKLITIKDLGRRKIIEITQKGRKII